MSVHCVEMGSIVLVKPRENRKGVVVNLRPDVDHYMVLFAGTTLAEAFRLSELTNTGKVIT